MKKASSLFPYLSDVLPYNKGFQEQMVFWAYKKSTGKTAERLMPVSFSRGELVLRFDDRRWSQVLGGNEEKAKIISAINGTLKYSLIKRIRITGDNA